MKQATPKKNETTKKEEPSQWLYRLREGLLILVAGGALFLLVALCTYHATDPGWSRVGTSEPVANAAGRAGAWFSDFVLYLLGYPAYALPVVVAYLAWQFFPRQSLTSDKKNTNDYRLLSLRLIGLLLLVVSGCGLLNLQAPTWHVDVPFASGGIVGTLAASWMLAEFNVVGASLVAFVIALFGITLFIGLSWLQIMDYLGKMVLQLTSGLFSRTAQSATVRINPMTNTPAVNPVSPPNAESLRSTTNAAVKAPERTPPVINLPPENTTAASKNTLGPAVKPRSDNREAQSFDREASAPQLLKSQPKTKSPVAVVDESLIGTLPTLDLLDFPQKTEIKKFSTEKLEFLSREVEERLRDFGVQVQVVAVHPGPVVTRFEMQLAPGIKVSKITGLAKDLARSLSVMSVRVVEVIPGKTVVGLELPNEEREIVRFSEMIASAAFEKTTSPISMALGKDIAGHPVIVDLAKMPHLLVAGTTGSGKSVGVNAMILSLLFKATAEDVRLIMIDPKMLELSIYDGIPHLLTPVVVDMKEAANALKWCVVEMDRRYKLMAAMGVRNLAGFNEKILAAEKEGQPILDPLWQPVPGQIAPALKKLPFVVVVVDEFADMMMVVGKKVEELIARIAQKARAAGIHLILATQRPSVDVITGLIKANIPTRIAFQVSSRIDSRTILDQQGAEQLLGQGDMLYLAPGTGVPVRIHGAYVADHEVHAVVNDVKRRGKPEYMPDILRGTSSDDGGDGEDGGSDSGDLDPLYDEAVQFVTQARRVSVSSVQRRFKIGFNRAARLVEQMEQEGVVSSMDGGAREVLAPPPVEA